MKKKARLWPVVLCGVSITSVAWVVAGSSFFSEGLVSQAEMYSYDSRDGKKEAEQDIERGVLKWKRHGLIYDFEAEQKIVREKLGVEIDWFAGCLSTEGIEAYARSYNATMRAHLVARFGSPLVSGVLGDPPPKPPQSE